MDINLLNDIGLNMIPGLGPRRYNKLIKHFHHSENILKASYGELLKCPGVGPQLAKEIISYELHYNAEEEYKRAHLAGIHIINRSHLQYPESLKAIYDAPIILYIRGNCKILNQYNKNIAIVGTRRPSNYGLDIARSIASDASCAAWNIVSGLALGIDSAAHSSAVNLHRPTIAVLGGGIGKIYPKDNVKLARDICEHGALISEYPILFPPDKRTFPMRNRIIAALSRAVLVVEADLNSGSLITADQALEYGRSVFAVPGRVDYPQSRGCHKLLKQGATLTESFKDIYEEFNLELGINRKSLQKDPLDKPDKAEVDLQLDKNEQSIMGILKPGEVHVDKICELSEMAMGKLLATLLNLETRKLIRLLPGKKYELINRRQHE
ncbi:DNA-processing protein DprA [Lentisphaera profundi]|uniref:DNA-processing protein DprA n=1 Tax=Lentisphaera profundi TaxID=1658616 RepID=A0ABY7VYV3_9BACT|nr:DNA-processing protein DprA [Lentisphaera profundi]WDE98380.1 DNA-processing protein DprA [Lentisphaera profundi]